MARQKTMRDLRLLVEASAVSSSSSSSDSSSDSSSSFDDIDVVLMNLAAMEEEDRSVLTEAKLNGGFLIDRITDSWLISNTRFNKADLLRLHAALQFPEKILLDNGSRVDSLEGLTLVLCRLSYPNRYCDHVGTFARSKSMISRIFNHTVKLVDEKCGCLLERFEQRWLRTDTLAAAVHKQCPLANCIGFVDGTVRGVCRPKFYQQRIYNGHKRKHALKFQGIMFPNGIMLMYGPWEGRRHDAFLLAESGVMEKLASLPALRDGSKCMLYGDAAYPRSIYIGKPFPEARITAEQQATNEAMSKVRECVEYGFGKILQNFAFMDFHKNLKLYLQPVATYYRVATVLTNCHTCLYGSTVTKLFEMEPPTLEEYLDFPA